MRATGAANWALLIPTAFIRQWLSHAAALHPGIDSTQPQSPSFTTAKLEQAEGDMVKNPHSSGYLPDCTFFLFQNIFYTECSLVGFS